MSCWCFSNAIDQKNVSTQISMHNIKRTFLVQRERNRLVHLGINAKDRLFREFGQKSRAGSLCSATASAMALSWGS